MLSVIRNFIYLLCVFILFCCKNNEEYTPVVLRKLTQEEVLNRTKNNIKVNLENTVYKNESGQIIPLDSLLLIPNIKEWTADSYVDDNNDVKELILRKATPEDIEFERKLREIIKNRSNKSVTIIDIDCEDTNSILEKIYTSDQGNRGSNKKIDSKIDRQNLVKVVSIIENCGVTRLGRKEMLTVWLVLQHADQYNRKKYFPLLKSEAEKGNLKKSRIALMEDRILVMDDKKQIYGSQITKDHKTGKWKLHDLENPEEVNQRRLKVGLKPLQDYVKKWDIEFNIPQTVNSTNSK